MKAILKSNPNKISDMTLAKFNVDSNELYFGNYKVKSPYGHMKISVNWQTVPRVDKIVYEIEEKEFHFFIFHCPICGYAFKIRKNHLLPLVSGHISCHACFDKKYTRKGETRVLLKNEHGKPIVYLEREPEIGYSYSHGDGRSISPISTKHNVPFSGLRFSSPRVYNDFYDRNDVDIEEIELINAKDFYGVDQIGFSYNLTTAFVDKWWNYDCPNIHRYSLGDGNMSTIFGMKLPLYFTNMVEWSIHGCYLDKRLTKAEIYALTYGHEDTTIHKECMAFLKKKDTSKEKLEEYLYWVHGYDQKIQKVINEHKAEILTTIEGVSAAPLDCGFINIFTTDEEYNERKRLVTGMKIKGDDGRDINFYKSMNLRLPKESQSLTLKKEQFKKVKEIVQEKLGIELYCTTMLD